MSLAKELTENKKEPEEVIDKYYKLFGLDDTQAEVQTEEKSDIVTEEKPIENNANEEVANSEGGIATTLQKQEESSEQTADAAIDNENSEAELQIDSTKRRARVYTPPVTTSVSDPLGTCHIEISPYEIDPTELHAKGQNVVLIDPKADVYSYYDAYAFGQDEYTIFKNMQRRFESSVFQNKKSSERVNWMTRKETAYRVKTVAVENEIRSLIGDSACENLTPENADEVADAINADERFGQYFTLHAAIRFIDRFANFDDPNMSLEDQCHEMLDCFVNIVKRAFHNRINIKLYVEEKTGRFGERIFINPSSYYENDKKYFKDKPLIFGLGKIYAPATSERQPVVVTIFNENEK